MNEPWIDPSKSEHHPLFGHMDKRADWQIRQALLSRRPTRQQLDELAAEELAGRDRASIYRVLAEFVRE